MGYVNPFDQLVVLALLVVLYGLARLPAFGGVFWKDSELRRLLPGKCKAAVGKGDALMTGEKKWPPMDS